jgi:hypothetical protein
VKHSATPTAEKRVSPRTVIQLANLLRRLDEPTTPCSPARESISSDRRAWVPDRQAAAYESSGSERGGGGYPRPVPFEQYHEPPEELPAETRTFARICTSLIEEAEAIGWYEQRLALETDRDARAIMDNAQQEEFKHFGMDLEFLLRRKPAFREILQGILFQSGDIVEHGERAEDEAS